MLGVILLRVPAASGGRTTSRKDVDATASWRASEEIRPVPAELRELSVVRISRWVLLAVGLAAIIVLPTFLSESNTLKAATVAVFAMIGLSVIVLTGWAGQVSLGQMAFVAVGAAVGAVATSEWNVDLTLGIIVAGLAGAVTAVVVGLPALRLQGLLPRGHDARVRAGGVELPAEPQAHELDPAPGASSVPSCGRRSTSRRSGRCTTSASA